MIFNYEYMYFLRDDHNLTNKDKSIDTSANSDNEPKSAIGESIKHKCGKLGTEPVSKKKREIQFKIMKICTRYIMGAITFIAISGIPRAMSTVAVS